MPKDVPAIDELLSESLLGLDDCEFSPGCLRSPGLAPETPEANDEGLDAPRWRAELSTEPTEAAVETLSKPWAPERSVGNRTFIVATGLLDLGPGAGIELECERASSSRNSGNSGTGVRDVGTRAVDRKSETRGGCAIVPQGRGKFRAAHLSPV